MGAYSTESDDYHFARRIEPLPRKKTIEAELMDWADDVTYAVHDMEDFYRSGRIPLHLLTSEHDERERQYFFDDVFDRWKTKDSSILSRRSELENVFHQMATDFFPIDRRYTGIEAQRAALRNLSGSLINRYITVVELVAENGECRLHID